MNILVLLFFVFFLPLVALLVWFALSSCLGDNVRARIGGTTINPRHGAYGRTYARNLPSYPGAAGSEAIEMEDMLHNDKCGPNDSDDEP
ncbi:hypothetical protein D6C81_04743 [Aureobasidium pullulans]|nr:hypothetical protein D6C81_04743 [Aureobasidium pullulans]